MGMRRAGIPRQSIAAIKRAYKDLFLSETPVAETSARLKAEGIEPFWCINHGITLSMYYRDPDGNQVELQVDVFDTLEETNAWLEQSDFDVNFLGVKYDPVEMIERYRAGEPRETLLARPVIDPSEVFNQLPEGGH